MATQLLSAVESTALVLTISNRQRHNALEPTIHAAGVEALIAAESNVDVACVVITGADGTFCSGENPWLLQQAQQQPPSVQAEASLGLANWIEAIDTCPKPVIAAIEGRASNAGFALALSCDLIVAARNATFRIDASRWALTPSGGVSWQLTQALPRQLVNELLLAGAPIDANRLHALGVVNRLCDPGSARETALAWADELATLAPATLANTKELLAEARTNDLHEQLDRERDHFVRSLHHPDASARLGAFLQKSDAPNQPARAARDPR